jgi:hypothetical protein
VKTLAENLVAMAVFIPTNQWYGSGVIDGKSYQIYDYPFTDVDGSPLALEMGVDISAQKG